MAERRIPRSPTSALRPLLPLAGLWLLGSAPLAWLITQQDLPREQLLLDANSLGSLPWYTGLVSSLGVLGWTTATVAAAGGGWVARLAGREPASELLRAGALLGALLLLDDLFQLHVVVTEALGLGKAPFYVAYVALGGSWAVVNRQELLRTRWPLLAAAGFALAGSVVTDLFGPRTEAGLIVEDSLKFLGILAWAQYFVITAGEILRSIAGASGHGREVDDPGPDGQDRGRAMGRRALTGPMG